jgi:hypothetical protein
MLRGPASIAPGTRQIYGLPNHVEARRHPFPQRPEDNAMEPYSPPGHCVQMLSSNVIL